MPNGRGLPGGHRARNNAGWAGDLSGAHWRGRGVWARRHLYEGWLGLLAVRLGCAGGAEGGDGMLRVRSGFGERLLSSRGADTRAAPPFGIDGINMDGKSERRSMRAARWMATSTPRLSRHSLRGPSADSGTRGGIGPCPSRYIHRGELRPDEARRESPPGLRLAWGSSSFIARHSRLSACGMAC